MYETMDRPVWGWDKHYLGDYYGNGKLAAYEVYIVMDGWRTMDPDRMRHIFGLMLATGNYGEGQNNRIKEVMAELNEEAHAHLP